MPASDFKRVEKLMQGCAFQDQPGTCPLDGPIEADRAMGEQIPVRATPTYVIEYKGRRLPADHGIPRTGPPASGDPTFRSICAVDVTG